LRNLSVPHVRLVFHTHETKVRAAFVFRGSQGAAQPVCSPETFANGLEEINEDFARLRGICHASKHLKLRNIRPVPGAKPHCDSGSVRSRTDCPTSSRGEPQNPNHRTSAHDAEVEHLTTLGADIAIFGEREIARGMIEELEPRIATGP
jgi:hypothetical protein